MLAIFSPVARFPNHTQFTAVWCANVQCNMHPKAPSDERDRQTWKDILSISSCYAWIPVFIQSSQVT